MIRFKDDITAYKHDVVITCISLARREIKYIIGRIHELECNDFVGKIYLIISNCKNYVNYEVSMFFQKSRIEVFPRKGSEVHELGSRIGLIFIDRTSMIC